MLSHLSFSFICLTLCSLSQVKKISGSNAIDVIDACATEAVRKVKCDWVKFINPNLECSRLTYCFGSNQILSDPTANLIHSYCSQVSALRSGGSGQDGPRGRRAVYNFATSPEKKWPSTIPYLFDSSIVSETYKNVVRGAISHIQEQTCIRFTEITQPPADTATSYLQYTLSTGCASFTGRSTDFQYSPIYGTDECLNKFGEMLYYTVQSLGLWHESQRPDADQYVAVNLSNVNPENQADFAPVPGTLQETYGFPYGYESIMHFPGRIFSRNGQITIRTLDPLYQNTIGQRVQLSFLDSKTLNRAYCADTCSGTVLTVPCENGGYQDPRDCSRCRCPDGYTGTACTVVESTVGEDICGGRVVVTNTEQLITSPGYGAPGYYEEDIGCTWQLVADNGGKIEARFEDEFGLHCENYACYHWVEMRYRGLLSNTGPRFCCNERPTAVLTSEGSEMLVIFRSNQTGLPTVERRGFKIIFKLAGSTTCACQNGGSCINGACVCPPQFTGVNCETPTVSSPCQNVTCLNGGTCQDGICLCPFGFTGPNCQTVTGGTGCIRECSNGGTCVNGSCICPTGYTGSACETILNTPCQNVNCLNGGTCSGGYCLCPPGYTGDRCQNTGCSRECQNGGSCDASGVCVCPPGYTGSSCETILVPSGCEPNPCRNNGTCSAGRSGRAITCDCPSPFYGTLCESASCGGCSAEPGYIQPKCQVQLSPRRTCNYTVTDEYEDCWCWIFNCKRTYSTRVIYYTCYNESCCDNAVEYNGACAVSGWGPWSECSAICGGGAKIRYYYDVIPKSDFSGRTLAAVRNETIESCNMQDCECENLESRRCAYAYKDGRCLVPAPFENAPPYYYNQRNCRKGHRRWWWPWG